MATDDRQDHKLGCVMSVDPHEHHELVKGPTPLGPLQWAGACKCGQQFRAVTKQDIYAKAQFHINRHNYHDDEPDGAA
jgi:hypothetical protein